MAESVKVFVPNIADMPTITFCKHLNLRHMPMAGLVSVIEFSIENGATRAERAYHEREHRINPDAYDHEHIGWGTHG